MCERHKNAHLNGRIIVRLLEVRISFVFVAFLISITDTLGHPFIRGRVLGFRLKQFAGFTSNDPDLDLSQELILELV